VTASTGPRLTTHVLDTAQGKPAAGVRIDVSSIDAAGRAHLLVTATTNAGGRTDAPLLAGDALPPGRYEIAFHVGACFAGRGLTMSRPALLDVVPVRFAIAQPAAHYHVPLLASPWAYSTYRGS